MTYDDALRYLDEHATYEKTGRIESPSLDNITALCAAMGDPQHAAPVVHITGTNGKGSTAQMISRLLVANGLTVGTYTSPHLERINERISRNLEPISDEDFAEQIAAIADLEPIVGIRPGYFEIVTAAAFRWFADVAVDAMVIEVGLLGRWDATNVVDATVAVVTNIGMDHTEFAGPTLEHIAREKSGIIKPRSATVVGETRPELVEIFRAAGGASFLAVDDAFEVMGNRLAIGGRLLDIRTPTTIYTDVYVPLNGAHQGHNAAVALVAAETFFAAPLSEEVVLEGFGAAAIPGRFEVLGRQPLTIVDGAHNPAGADVCAQVFFEDFDPDGRRLLVVGTLRDPEEMLAALRADEFDVVFACTAPSPRGVPAADIVAAAKRLGCDDVYAFDTVEAACRRAMQYADGDDAVLVTGSLYTAGAARPILQQLAN
ncbi:MAG TPA: folylpolyglutamate synthase/dihydrofolate synthase family protein [Ilumatobacteraceae bacterium]|nr:folylpolyglutamate synthase/dihydrofolate synthase family protein [Ilumatobacteraceae bacterium]